MSNWYPLAASDGDVVRDAATWSLFTKFGEDLRLEATPAGTRLTWTFAYTGVPAPAPVLKLSSAVNSRVLGSVARGVRTAVEQKGARR
ncbi:hypothetical protein [Amycolatopsis benzoatilytica]|uniref:hypothetical protein n=1 Tax=Amycolatopsis benzoatilytica TaxID=346045 RepID=UPI00036FE0DF|nr:hypothetical protein [Amycolatopsis benzoatilytica]